MRKSETQKILAGLTQCIEVLEKQDIANLVAVISEKKTKTDRLCFEINSWRVTFKKKSRSEQK
jgi:hypothetical protein